MTINLCDLEYSVARLSLVTDDSSCHLIILTPDTIGQNGDIIPARSTMIHGMENIKALSNFLDLHLNARFSEQSLCKDDM